ncbi:MFS transporter [uncultured Clostridium sp.]|uniref:MFS transporter n=1 Tax=uncultured Clostridium sp. TaxID=59620 RepID=UPI0028E7D4F1|nr:MFS transporter [uncultured Clostridium sp.]
MKREKKIVNTNIILLLLGRMISDTGTGIQMIIIPLYIIDVGGSAASVGLFSFLSLLPLLIAYPFAGVIGDRLNRKTIMVATDITSAAAILGLTFAAYTDKINLTLLLTVQVIVSLLNGLFDPATKGMLPQLVAPEKLTQANSTLASLRTLSGLLSPILGAILYEKLGIASIFLINGISFLLSGSCSMLINYKHVKRESAAGAQGYIADLSQGIKFVLDNKIISKLCTFFLLIYAIIQPIFTVVLPLFFKTQLAYSDKQYGYLQMILILGALLGSILVALLFGKENKISNPLMIGCGLLMVTMLAFSVLLFPRILYFLGTGTLLYFVFLSAILFLLSVAIMLINVPVQTFIQKHTPDEYMSRMFSIVGMITKGGMPFGGLVYGIMLNKVPVYLVMLSATILILSISVAFLYSLIKISDSL